MRLEEQIKNIIQDENDTLIGFADMTGLLDKKFEDYNYCVVLGLKLNDLIIDLIENGPTPEYHKHYNETNKKLKELTNKLARGLKEINISNIIIPHSAGDKTNKVYNAETLTYNFSQKKAATRAGLGWIGKTDLFISKKFGPRLRLASILIDRPVKCEHPPINESGCGDCVVCVEKCPAKASNGVLWNIDIKRDEFFDAYKCKAKCRELAWKRLGKEITLCGICVSVCPIGKRKR